MKLKDPWWVVSQWLDASWMLGIGVAGVVLVVLGFRRDDVIRPVFLVAGVGLIAVGFGGHFFGWRL